MTNDSEGHDVVVVPFLYSVREACAALGGVSTPTVYALLRNGELKSCLIGRRRFIPRSELEAFVERNTKAAAI